MWLLLCKVCTCTSWCGTLLVDMSVPSYSLVSPSLPMQSGITPLLMAAQEGHAEVAQFLLGNGSSVTEQDNVGWLKQILTSCDHLMLLPRACTPVTVPQTQWRVCPSSVVKLAWPPLRCFIVACTAIGLINITWNWCFEPWLFVNCYRVRGVVGDWFIYRCGWQLLAGVLMRCWEINWIYRMRC